MAIVDGKRKAGVHFYKVKGRRSWVAYIEDDTRDQYSGGQLVGLVVEYSGDDPIHEKFRYCSPIAQPVFLVASNYRGWPCAAKYTPSSWKKMPEGWREMFRRDLFPACGGSND